MASERRLQLRYRRPGATGWTDGVQWTCHGEGAIVVVKPDTWRDMSRAAQAMRPGKGIPAGTPILWMPAGAEFEVWEIEALTPDADGGGG